LLISLITRSLKQKQGLEMKKVIIAASIAFLLSSLPTIANADMLSTAKKYVGLTERGHTATIKQLIGANPRSTKWCGLFIKAIAKKNGKKIPSNPASSQSWKQVGVKISKPKPGDIAILSSHVTIFTRYKNGRMCGVGGNQSNSVQESCYSSKRISFRRL
jgi:uncharacterized protein (TIGR02594 family)